MEKKYKTISLKEEILRKHGFINGLSIFSNPKQAKQSLYQAMEEYASIKRTNLSDSKIDLVKLKKQLDEALDKETRESLTEYLNSKENNNKEDEKRT